MDFIRSVLSLAASTDENYVKLIRISNFDHPTRETLKSPSRSAPSSSHCSVHKNYCTTEKFVKFHLLSCACFGPFKKLKIKFDRRSGRRDAKRMTKKQMKYALNESENCENEAGGRSRVRLLINGKWNCELLERKLRILLGTFFIVISTVWSQPHILAHQRAA